MRVKVKHWLQLTEEEKQRMLFWLTK